MRLVDSQVSSFAPAPVAAGASYRFERLPSQQINAVWQDQLEAIAAQALAKVGLQRNDSTPELTAQVFLTQRVESLTPDGLAFGGHWGWRMGPHGGIGHAPLFAGLANRPGYWREVRLILRDSTNAAVVFETRASHDGPWADSLAVLPAMFDAALQGFPNPPPGERRITIDIPR